MVLIGLADKLFDQVSIDQMKEAKDAVIKDADKIPIQVQMRLKTADKMSDEDHEMIIQIVKGALDHFQPKPCFQTDLDSVKSKPEVKS
jgi:hypothetical protein